jgi:serine/threonine-protein kinase
VKIASGATATVYLARTRGKVGRLVAVKRAHPHLVDDRGAREALLAEARVAARVHHANVAAVHEVEETDDDVLLVMDWIEGASLAELLDLAVDGGQRIDAPVALRIALDVCAGLSAVHELRDDDGRPMGLVHRDVSPQNVLVGVDGVARLTDFGLARLVRRAELSRTTGTVQGKVAYVAPEVVEGGAHDVRSDLFALGVVAWEALTGRRLFRGANEADTLRRVLNGRVPPVSEHVPAIGPDVDAAIAAALDRDPALRPESVEAFAGALEAAARREGLLGTARDVGAHVRARCGQRLVERRRLLAAALSVAGASPATEGAFGETASLVGPAPTADVPNPVPLTADDAPTPIEDRPTLTVLHGGRFEAPRRAPTADAELADPPTTETVAAAPRALSPRREPARTSAPPPRSAAPRPLAAALAGGALAALALVLWPRDPPAPHPADPQATTASAPNVPPPAATVAATAADDMVVEEEPASTASAASRPRARPPRVKDKEKESPPTDSASDDKPKPPPNPYLKRR